jgi:hypothetical protein
MPSVRPPPALPCAGERGEPRPAFPRVRREAHGARRRIRRRQHETCARPHRALPEHVEVQAVGAGVARQRGDQDIRRARRPDERRCCLCLDAAARVGLFRRSPSLPLIVRGSSEPGIGGRLCFRWLRSSRMNPARGPLGTTRRWASRGSLTTKEQLRGAQRRRGAGWRLMTRGNGTKPQLPRRLLSRRPWSRVRCGDQAVAGPTARHRRSRPPARS